MTLDRKAARERCGAATDGPWTSDGDIVGWLGGMAPAVAVRSWTPAEPLTDAVVEGAELIRAWSNTGSPVCMVQPQGSCQCGSDPVGGSDRPIEDAAFIAHARDDLPAALDLLEDIERLTERMLYAPPEMWQSLITELQQLMEMDR